MNVRTDDKPYLCKECGNWFGEELKTNRTKTTCKPCVNEQTRLRSQKQREKMGEEAYLAHRREIVRKSREKRGPEYDRKYQHAKHQAVQRLIKNHKTEFKIIFEAERSKEGL